MRLSIALSLSLSLSLALALALPAPAQDTSRRAPAAQPARGGDAAAQAPRPAAQPAARPDAVAEKFRKLQREMSGSARGEYSAAADTPGAPAGAPAREAESPGLLATSIKIVFGLVFVVLLAVVAIRVLKRFQGSMLSRGGRRASGEIFEVLETCHLGPHQRIVALRMKDDVGVVGVTQQGITLLTVLKEPAEELRAKLGGPGNSAAFSENLNKLLERFKRPKRVSDLLDET